MFLLLFDPEAFKTCKNTINLILLADFLSGKILNFTTPLRDNLYMKNFTSILWKFIDLWNT